MQTPTMRPALLLMTGLLLTACNSSGDAPSSASSASVTSAAKPSAAAPDFSPWDLRAIRTAMVGSYVFKSSNYQAWDLRADDATISGDYLGKEEVAVATVELVAPCSLRVKTKDENVGSRERFLQFTLKNGFFPSGGGGGAGMKKGNEVVYCQSNIVYRSGKAGCSKWTYQLDQWIRSDAKCGLRDAEGKPAFWPDLDEKHPVYSHQIDGEALFPGTLPPTPPLRLANFAAAKAKAAELSKAD